MAFFDAVPKDSSKSRREQILATIGEARLQKAMPPLEPGDWYLVKDFNEIGRVQHGGMGMQPLSWSELSAWVSRTGARMTGEECSLIRAMSSAYAGALRSGSEKNAAPPYVGSSGE